MKQNIQEQKTKKQHVKSVKKNVSNSLSQHKEEKPSMVHSVPLSVRKRERVLMGVVVLLVLALISIVWIQHSIHTTENLLHVLCNVYGGGGDAVEIIPSPEQSMVLITCEQQFPLLMENNITLQVVS